MREFNLVFGLGTSPTWAQAPALLAICFAIAGLYLMAYSRTLKQLIATTGTLVMAVGYMWIVEGVVAFKTKAIGERLTWAPYEVPESRELPISYLVVATLLTIMVMVVVGSSARRRQIRRMLLSAVSLGLSIVTLFGVFNLTGILSAEIAEMGQLWGIFTSLVAAMAALVWWMLARKTPADSITDDVTIKHYA